MSEKIVSEVMSRKVLSVRPDETLENVAAKMHGLHVSGFPVVDTSGRLVGVVTERDLGRGLGQGRASNTPTTFLDLLAHHQTLDDRETLAVLRGRFRRMHVDAVMSREPASVGPEATLVEAARIFAEKGLHRLPVVDKGVVVGVISYRDLLAEFARGAGR